MQATILATTASRYPFTGARQWERPGTEAAPVAHYGGIAPPGYAQPGPEFIPSPAFAGARPGYVFTTGAQGLGYYVDHGPQKQKKVGACQLKSVAEV